MNKKKKLVLTRAAWGRLPGWIAAPRLFWWAIFVILSALLFGWLIGELSNTDKIARIRYSGLLLDLCGLFSVAVGLSRKLNLFHGSTILGAVRKAFTDWIRQFPLVSRSVVIQGVGSIVIASGATVSGRGTSKTNPNEPLENQVAFLLRRNDEITKQLFDLHDADRTMEQKLGTEIKELRSALQTEISQVQTRTAEAQVGQVGWEFVGLVWICLGIILATVPELVAQLVP
jgi:hypothetical protein